MRCGDSWQYKKPGSVSYSSNRGMFPVCRECQDSISKYELYNYCDKLTRSWVRYHRMNKQAARKAMTGVFETLYSVK